MRLKTATILAGTLLLSSLATLADAAPPAGDEDYTLDLTALPRGPTIYLKCSRGDTLTDCGIVSVWQQSNNVPGLQTIPMPYGGVVRPSDTPLLA